MAAQEKCGRNYFLKLGKLPEVFRTQYTTKKVTGDN